MAVFSAPDAWLKRSVAPYSASDNPEFSPVKEPTALFV